MKLPENWLQSVVVMLLAVLCLMFVIGLIYAVSLFTKVAQSSMGGHTYFEKEIA